MKETFLKVLTVSAPKLDKDGINFKVVEFQAFMLIGTRESLIKGTVKMTMWPANYKRTIEGKVRDFRGDAEYDIVQSGDIYAGNAFTCETTPYKISEDGGYIRSWRGAVFFGQNPLVVAAKALRNNGAKPLFEDTDTGKMVPFSLPDTGVVSTKPRMVGENAGGGTDDEQDAPQ